MDASVKFLQWFSLWNKKYILKIYVQGFIPSHLSMQKKDFKIPIYKWK